MFVRRGMWGMPHREHGWTANRTDLFPSASVTAEEVFELTVLMVTSVFARLVPWNYGCSESVCSSSIDGIDKCKYNSRIKYTLSHTVLCMFLTVRILQCIAMKQQFVITH
jgi:hypothetical protein